VIVDNCVIAANSVVTKDIPNGSVAAGIPAKVIREVVILKESLYKHYKNYKSPSFFSNLYFFNFVKV